MSKHKIGRAFLQCILSIILLASGMHLMGQAPSATTEAASGVGSTDATVNGTVNANGFSTTVTFEYGLDTGYGSTWTADQSPVTGSTDTAVSATLGELLPGTTYHYRVVATNGSGTTNGADMAFTTLPAPPVVLTGAATAVGTDTATLNGIVNPQGDSTTVTFEYGTDTGYGTTVTADQSPVAGSGAQPVSKTITGLSNNTTYHYRVVAQNSGGTDYGNDMTFTTGAGAAPTAATNAAAGIGSGTATLNGTVNANNADTIVTFEYGLDTGYGSTALAIQSPVTGSTDTAVSVTLSEFLPNTTYHYRVSATNINGTVNGADMTFTTLPLAPTVATNAASPVGTSTATLNGTVNANGDSTTVTFEYGLDTGYGATVPAAQSPVSGSTNTAVSSAISGLTNGITYHYRVVATNAGGTTYGADMTFTTGAAAPTATTNAASGIGVTGATLNGTVNANNSSTTVTFEYGLTTAYDRSVNAVQSPVTGSTNTAVNAAVSDLLPNTTYHYRVAAVNAGGTTYGADMTFTTLAAPTVVTTAASSVTTTGATLNGTVNANSSSTTVTFEYGTSTAYGTTVTADQSPVTGSTAAAVSKAVTGLTPNTTYHYRVVGQNASGTSCGADMTFVTTVGAAPTVTTNPASAVLLNGATLNGTVTANNSSTTVTFEYGTSIIYGTTVTADQSPVNGVGVPVSKTITGLANNTTYHYRVVGTNANGTGNGADMTFTTSSNPTVQADPATNVLTTSAALNGTVNANYGGYNIFFEYSTDLSYSNSVTATPNIVTGTSDTPVSANITGLTPNTLYNYRVRAYSGISSFYSSSMTFTTLTGPTVTTNAASAVGSTSATLNGTINANNSSTTATFELGETIGYGRTVTADQNPVTGSVDTAVSTTLTDLVPNTTYHYRAVGTNIDGSVYGTDMTFTTGGSPPNADTNAAAAVTGTGATLNGIVNANNDSTTVTFQYGLTTSYGTTVPADQSPVTGVNNTPVSTAITGLTNNTTYHYRVAAQNGSGTTYGADMTFFTGTAAPTVTTGTASGIGSTSATLNGTVNANNGSTTVTFEYGETVGYGRTVTADQSPVTGSIDTAVSVNVTDLNPNITYHFRAVGQNAAGTSCGADMTFTTNAANTPMVTTANVTDIAALSATSGGNVTGEGGAPVTARGVCWSTTLNPTTADNFTVDGSGSGAFTSTLTGLNQLTIYYVRAYATNLYGTVYGEEFSFTTNPGSISTVTTANVTAITAVSAVSGGNVIDEGDAPVTARGVCWSNAPNPTIANNSTSDGTGPGAFTSNLINLTENTTYYVRAYATNIYGTSYGSQLQFTTNAGSAPTVTTANVTAITTVSAVSGGNVIDEGDAPVTARGVCWSTAPTPTITDNTTSDGTGPGAFTSSLTSLTPNTTYYVRAYATNIYGTSYGSQLQFTTNSTNAPTVTTANVTAITTVSAVSGGNVIDEGDAPVTARGVCWSTALTPTITDNTTSDGTGPGAFTSSLTGLTPNITYYVRAYATNIYGTSYGSQLQFTTNSTNAPTVTTANVTEITADSARSGGNVTNNGGSPVTARGVCWSSAPNPTIADNITSDGTGPGVFTSTLTGLTANTTYYVRAYANNLYGTAYGSEFQFTTGSAAVSFSITEPGDGEVVSGTVTIAASASAGTSPAGTIMALSIAKVEFYIDDTLIAVVTSSPYETQWDTTTVSNGSHTIEAAAFDQNDNSDRDEITVTVNNGVIPSEIMLNRTNLNYGSVFHAGGSVTTGPQTLLINNSGGGTLNWAITKDAEWLTCSPDSGVGPGVVSVSVDPSGLAPGFYSASITVTDLNQSNSKALPVSLTVYEQGTTSAPFGFFESPGDNALVTGSIPVTGWVLDDIEVSSVKIYRAPVAGEGTGMVYIGNAVLVDGARPDVEAAYPDYPLNYQAGWGYMLLTYGLPNQGSGTYTLYAEAVDAEGKTYALGSKTIISDNTDAVKPFGAIDTPAQGGIASGQSYANFGWVLTPQPNTIPVDGSTITVWVDGVPLGNPVYNRYRSDIAALFPGYNNSDGAGGQFYLDTTRYINGVHTISWTATDDAGNAEGIGSRYFTVQNWQGAGSRAQGAGSVGHGAGSMGQRVACLEPVGIIKGYARNVEPRMLYPDDNGMINIEINQSERLEIHLGDLNSSSFYSGYRLMDDQFRPLPIGSTLDTGNGVFFWHPGPAFKGRFPLVFVIESPTGQSYKKSVVVTIIEPK